ncbi:MAG: hypothetical protein KatS3mg119_0515 [Rhodothalassiaceae bacterium]|nr:MAG: hypothetical protein KatS3mg119_0515 [Rhodothalassiaceae bacterium]
MTDQRRGWIVTAHELWSGAGVFLAADGRWLRDPAGAAFAATPAERDGLLQRAREANARAEVELVAAIEAECDAEGRVRPVKLRERLRALGPSVRPDLWERDVIERRGDVPL